MKNIRYYIFWLLDYLKGNRIRKHYDEICLLMRSDNISEWQKKRISTLIKNASENTDYYKAYEKYKDIRECPIINKAIIKDNYDKFLSRKYERATLHKMSTSGSTGTPFEILQNPEKRNRVLAELIYFNELVGQNIGDKFIFYRVWTKKNKKNVLERIKQNLIPINILRLDNKNLNYIVKVLLKNKNIKSTLAYASTYDAILKYLKDNNIRGDFQVKAMISSSEVLLDETKKGLEDIIGCCVINRYSNQECGVLAQSIPDNKNMLINNAGYFIEVLKIDSDKPVEPGEIGRIVVTDLFNDAMPLIRYDTGDLGVLSKGKDSFENIQGRRVDIIYDTKGRPLTPHTWSVYMWKFEHLKQYQFIQEDRAKYILKVNGASGVYNIDEFDRTLREILGDDADITIDYVDEIPVLESGKFKKTICKYNGLK